MLDKIVLSKDRKHALVVFDTHSVSFSSDEDVVCLVLEIIIEPTVRYEELMARCNEDTWVPEMDPIREVV